MFWKNKKKKEDAKTTDVPVLNNTITLEERDRLAEPKIIRMLHFLKENYDYDGVDYYHYQKPYTQYGPFTILEEALDYVSRRYSSLYGYEIESPHVKSFRETLLSKFHSIKIIHLTRSYGAIRRSSYIFLYTTADSLNNVRVLIPYDYNLSDLFDVKAYVDPFLKCISPEYINDYLEFKETLDEHGQYTYGFESVIDILFNISNKRGCISFDSADETNERQGKLCIRYYPDEQRYYNHKIDYQISFGKTIIKQKVIDDSFLNRSIENFIFPLNQTYQQLDDLGLTPVFTEEYMAQDFSDFISIQDMLKI